MSNTAVQPSPRLPSDVISSIKRLPSIEMQTQAFFNAAQSSGGSEYEIKLSWNGFRVHMNYANELPFGQGTTLKDFLILRDTYVPTQYRKRGWFTQYCVFCSQLAAQHFIIASELPSTLSLHLAKHGFIAHHPDFYMLDDAY